MSKTNNSVEIGSPTISYGTYTGREEIEKLEDKVSELLNGGLQDHPAGLEGVKIAPIDDLSLLPEDIIRVMCRIKGKTIDVFDFCIVEVSKDIPEHSHDEDVGEIYFASDGGVNITTLLGKNHLKRGRYSAVGPGRTHGVKKIDNDKSTFVAVKFRKEKEENE